MVTDLSLSAWIECLLGINLGLRNPRLRSFKEINVLLSSIPTYVYLRTVVSEAVHTYK